MRDFIRKPKNWLAVCIVLTFLFALIYSFSAATRANLPSYVQPNVELRAEETEPPLDTILYEAESIRLSMLAPADWTHVVKGGADTFVNPRDGASLSFQISGYNPGANMVTEELAAADVAALGGVMGGFAKDSNSAYLVIYELGAVDYFEYTTWDLSTFVRITLQVPAQRYTEYYDTAVYLFDSLAWEKETPIPEGFNLFYSSYGGFEFGVPEGWGAVIENGAYIATSPNGSRLTATVTQTGADLSGLSQLDYISAASQGKQGYLLASYSNTGSLLIAEASYNVGGETWVNVHNILASGEYMYEFIFDCREEAYPTDGSLFLTAMNLFRVF